MTLVALAMCAASHRRSAPWMDSGAQHRAGGVSRRWTMRRTSPLAT